MTNSEQAIREFADGIMKSHETWGKPWNAEMREEGIEEIMEITTALISEHYVAKEEVDKMVSERLRNELMRYDQWLLANDMGQMFDDTMKCVDEYLKSRER